MMRARSNLTTPKPIKGRIAPRPKLAATLVVLRGCAGKQQILMGKRSARHDFMPNVYVFPGGRVERADSIAPAHDRLNARTHKILTAAMTPARAHACVLAAIRETFEETSLVLGKASPALPYAVNDPTWKAFHKLGFLPTINDIEVFGRAITPPHRNKRFDTWFFVVKLDKEAGQRPCKASAELVEIGWYNFQECKALETHHATQMMLQELEAHLKLATPPPHVFFSKAVCGQLEFSRFPQA